MHSNVKIDVILQTVSTIPKV